MLVSPALRFGCQSYHDLHLPHRIFVVCNVSDDKETFTCRNEEGKEPDVRYHELSSEIPSIRRDNSLIEFDEKGRPVPEPATQATKKVGGEKDALDYGEYFLNHRMVSMEKRMI